MVYRTCFGFCCKCNGINPGIVTCIAANGYHHQKSWESSTTRKVVKTAGDLKKNKLNQAEICLSFFGQPRLIYLNSPLSASISSSMIKIEYLSETPSIELIDQDLSSDSEVYTLYSDSTRDFSTRICRYVTYPRVSPRSTSNFSDNYSQRKVTQSTKSSSSHLEVSSLYSSSTRDYSQGRNGYVCYR